MNILAIDPGTTESGFVLIDETLRLKGKGKVDNVELFDCSRAIFQTADIVAIEMPACYGMAVGKSVFETVLWVGRFTAKAEEYHRRWVRVYRKAENKEDGIGGVCMTICKSNKANDSNIRQAIIDMYKPSGGGRVPQIGTKAKPGPLYGMAGDMWAALAVGITVVKSLKEKNK